MEEPKRQWRIWCSFVLWGVVGLFCLHANTLAAPRAQVPVVAPSAVTTPGPPVANQPVAEIPFTHGFDQARYYTVQPDDTLLSVALEVGVDIDRMNCVIAPDFSWEQPLIIGDVLEIPPMETICHSVQPGDTLASIAQRYGVTADAIVAVEWNRLSSVAQSLTPGWHLRVPSSGTDVNAAGRSLARLLAQPVGALPLVSQPIGGVREGPVAGPVPKNWPFGSGNFRWPTYGWLSQGYHWAHRAVDIAAPPGTLVTAADRGVVVRAGWNNQGYGNFVVIDHNIDYVTLYAHLSEIYVAEGQVVAPGDPLGTVGSTGNTTGPHLHFEIRDFGYRIDPLELLVR
jgi:hypothetical protein